MIDDPTFVWRAPFGILALLALAVRDRHRTGTWDRARELAFLFAVTGATLAWAITHDAITWSISRDYFVIGKDLPAAETSFAPVALLGAHAGWTAGLALGLVLLVANNPRADCPQLPYRALANEVALAAACSLAAAVIGAAIGSVAIRSIACALHDVGVRDARAFGIAQGAHLGSYVGLALAIIASWRRVRATRWRSVPPPAPTDPRRASAPPA